LKLRAVLGTANPLMRAIRCRHATMPPNAPILCGVVLNTPPSGKFTPAEHPDHGDRSGSLITPSWEPRRYDAGWLSQPGTHARR
jgi:hypothetical protein